MQHQVHTQGFTLIEVLLYSLIASTFLAVVSIFLGTSLEGNTKQRVIADVETQGAAIVSRMTQVIRNAEGITTPTEGATGTSLVLDVVDAGLDPTTFDIDTGVLQIDEGGGSAEDLSNNRVTASNFVARNYTRGASPGTVQVEFTLTAVNDNGRQPFEYSRTFYTSASIRYD